MTLPNSYAQKFNAIPAYFDAMLDAQPPERFTLKFLENLGFSSSNDRLFIGILKELGFLDTDGSPQQRYFEFLDRSQSRIILGKAVEEMYQDLFAVVKNANTLPPGEIKNKLRTLYAGKKSDTVIDRISKTFNALCDYADFSIQAKAEKKPEPKKEEQKVPPTQTAKEQKSAHTSIPSISSAVALDSLQYHINIVLPESRDQAVYDAIFRSLREHLGTRHG